ncbi:unnamed protein product, partial [marine sediment metagenome]
ESYCNSNGLLFAFALEGQRPVMDWVDLINSHYFGYLVMSGGKIKLGCYRLQDPVATLTVDDLVVESEDDVPVQIKKRPYKDTANKIELSWTNRAKLYENSVVVANDEVDQRVSRKVRTRSLQLAGITESELAQDTAYRMLFESLFRFTSYIFKLGYKNMLLEAGDVVLLSDGGVIVEQRVRITMVRQSKDGRTLDVEAMEDLPYLYEIAEAEAASPD